MSDTQELVFRWITTQPNATAAVVFFAGVLYAFHGFRMFRFLLVVSCAALGWGGGIVLAHFARTPELPTCAGALMTCALIALRWEQAAVLLSCGATWAVLGLFFAEKFGAAPLVALAVAGFCGLLGLMFARLCYRTMTVVLTTMQGVILLIVGFVGASDMVVPSLTDTFRAWASDSAFLIPILMGMLFTAAYSYQSMMQRGDIRSGR